ncbi:MAG: sulfatase [Rhodobacteraceae bacterium]|nr:MAG: sulfatase [Paracoccaceae bacterium]
MTDTRSPEPPVIGRRAFLAGSAAMTAAATLGLAQRAMASGATPPNIVYIISDDQGWKDVGYRGSDILTPNIDRLAAEGTRMRDFYAQPLCTPSRAALMTGRYPLRYGLQVGVIPSGGVYGLDTEEYLLPQAMKDAGYRTAMVGKWHLGHADTKFWPRSRGFDTFYGALVGEIDHFEHTAHGITDWYRNEDVIEEEGFVTTLFGQEAARVVEAHDGSAPLFLYLAFTAPHTPYQAPDEYLARYAHVEDENRRTYSAMITAMDDEIGRVLAALEAKGMRENTLIVFQSDNGGVTSAAYTGESEVAGTLPADNGPYRDGKGSIYEGGTRVAALMNWPGHVPVGEVTGMMHNVDMLPTLASVAGATLAKSKPLDGMDMWPTIRDGGTSPRTSMVYNIDPTNGTLREGDMKLVWTAALPPRVELYDLAADPGETTNLAEQMPEVVARLQAEVLRLANEMAMPLLIPDSIGIVYSQPPVFAGR